MSNQPTYHPIDVAIDFWLSGVQSVDPRQLLRNHVIADSARLRIGEQSFSTSDFDRIRVVGAGKVAGTMAEALEDALGPDLAIDKKASGLVNVPYDKSGGRLSTGSRIWQFPARPIGENLPTTDAFGATLLIEDLVQQAGPRELCICLLSGGASALLTHPPKKVKLADKRKLVQWLGRSGASIQQINTVRKHVSDVKGGRLAARFNGFHMACLIIPDVIGDQIDIIGSGPTVADPSTAADAWAIVRKLDPKLRNIPASIQRHLKRKKPTAIEMPHNVSNHIMGHISQAINRVVEIAKAKHFDCSSELQTDEFETVEQAGQRMGQWILDRMSPSKQPQMIVSGGEPVVHLGSNPGTGGRNSHLVLVALEHILKANIAINQPFALLSGGTDGEDGNAPASGAWISNQTLKRVRQTGLNPAAFLKTNNAHQFFAQLGLGIFPGSSKYRTNVCDLRIGLIGENPKAI